MAEFTLPLNLSDRAIDVADGIKDTFNLPVIVRPPYEGCSDQTIDLEIECNVPAVQRLEIEAFIAGFLACLEYTPENR